MALDVMISVNILVTLDLIMSHVSLDACYPPLLTSALIRCTAQQRRGQWKYIRGEVLLSSMLQQPINIITSHCHRPSGLIGPTAVWVICTIRICSCANGGNSVAMSATGWFGVEKHFHHHASAIKVPEEWLTFERTIFSTISSWPRKILS